MNTYVSFYFFLLDAVAFDDETSLAKSN